MEMFRLSPDNSSPFRKYRGGILGDLAELDGLLRAQGRMIQDPHDIRHGQRLQLVHLGILGMAPNRRLGGTVFYLSMTRAPMELQLNGMMIGDRFNGSPTRPACLLA